ncbi:methyl-accepting chemotaxis protein [Paenibacillus sp. J2TS4]|uniref:methyl-accepting chemotaxis protein n=1 Tax=Paenibacillus sp. J2TS4 TaxID=2807194 RepID=UPI001B264E80|nr:methyl-accepting chemotaxis protein [Paenibacillus sp. J2TS4]GIP34726.1 methyl-accepting chemotaxis protein [Paenibacillus sp. J2TS4]
MKFGIVKKMVLGITLVSLTTYGTSALFIFVLKDFIASGMSDWLYISIILGLGVFWTGFLGWLAANWFIKPLLKLTEAVNEAAKGNLQVTLPVHHSKDEMSTLSVSFNTMVDNLKQMIAEVSNNVNFTNQNAASLSGAITQAAHQVETIASTIDDIAQGVDQQEKSTLSTFTSVEQITRAAEDVSDKANSALQLAHDMVGAIQESGEVVHSLVNGLLGLTQANQQTIDLVQELDRNAVEIGNISLVVGEIADQTHLLALNASIESARAGEHGAGFAVVAGEIRKLAEQSSSAVSSINELIQQIQKHVAHVVSNITNQVQMVDQESSKGEQVKQALSRITAATNETTESVDRIAEVVSDQVRQIENTLEETREIAKIVKVISEGAKRVALSTQEQTAVMQEIASSSEVLKEHADSLNGKVKVFRL